MVKHRRRVGRNICKSSSTSARASAEFFKVFLPDRSTHNLLIPPDFIKNFNRIIQEKIILKDIGGKIWHVDVERTRDGVFLKNGWQNFVSHHCLSMGEFLVFRYDGSYSFVVKIFGINGCKKQISGADKKANARVKNEENNEVQEIETKPTSCKRGRIHKEDPSLRGHHRTGISKDVEEVNVQNVASDELPEPKSLCFVLPAIKAKQYRLKIPNEVMSWQGVHDMVLRNEEGTEWPIKVYKQKDRRTYIGKGLSAFRNDNNVRFKDSFRFSFNQTDSSSNKIDVQIIRATPESG